MTKILNWWFGWKLKRMKQWALYAVKKDMDFIESYRADQLAFDMANARKRLAEERKKETPNEDVVYDLSVKISHAEAVRAEYEKLQTIANELPLYIEMI